MKDSMGVLFSLVVFGMLALLSPRYALGAESHQFSYATMTEVSATGPKNLMYHYYRFFDRKGGFLGIVVYAHDAETRGLASLGAPLFPGKAGKVDLSCFEPAPGGTTFLMTNNPSRPELAAYDRCRFDTRPGVALRGR